LEFKYLLASIWEGQEGGFLLWSIWHAVLGCILIFKSREWQAPVMSVICSAQFFLMLMILGIYFFGAKIGSSPFALTRNELDLSNAPMFTELATGLLKNSYLSFLKDGVGLNVLLRNYWMVIHPPVLFLGFASTIVPFSFAYAGIQTKKIGEWVKPVFPWALFSLGILGVGIMMGGKWAYESLNFGGYWAWDPVENASLVPWLILVGGVHTMLIYKATERSLRTTYLFTFLCFSFILYSTFLTRTGVLGDTSVHAFTEAGRAMNILIGSFMGFYVLGSLVLYFVSLKKIPIILSEEKLNTRVHQYQNISAPAEPPDQKNSWEGTCAPRKC
jgi:cytochrome c-type biogenesis protein CcmF